MLNKIVTADSSDDSLALIDANEYDESAKEMKLKYDQSTALKFSKNEDLLDEEND